MNEKEQKIKQIETAILLRRAELWQLTCNMKNIRKAIALKEVEERVLLSQLNQLKLEVSSPGELEKLPETEIKPIVVQKPEFPI